jgi:hypothetical protein
MKSRIRNKKTRTRNRKTKRNKKGGEGEDDKIKKYIDAATENEKMITPILEDIVVNFNKADPITDKIKLEGLEFKIKSEKSLRSKMLTKVPQDILRYTFIIPETNFTENIVALNGYLHGASIFLEKTRSKNYFCHGNVYKGINRTYRYNDYLFEIQFHTQISFDVKTHETHTLYEKFREKCKEKECTKEEKESKCELAKEMIRSNVKIKTTYTDETCIHQKTYCEPEGGRLKKFR